MKVDAEFKIIFLILFLISHPLIQEEFSSQLLVPSEESGTRPLTFTFVPSIGRLPTHFQVVDVCKLLVRTSEEPNNESSQEIINRSTVVSDDLTLKSGIRQDSESTYHAGTSQKIFRPKGCKTSKGEMQESDLFKAEFVFITDSDEGDEETISRNNVQQPSVGHGTGHARCQLLATSHISSGGESSKPHGDLNVPETQCAVLSHSATRSPKQHQALEEPIKTEKVTEDTTLDTHSEMCSPAQLRQQTEELCAAIDQVLQDPLPMRRCESSPSSLHTSMDSDVGKMSATLQRAAGRETRYANLYLPTPSVTESQLTKPGVIRPGPVKTKTLLKTEEPYQPNPFKKYLEETRDPDIEQDNAPLHPLYPTKLIPATKSPLHPQSICHADCLTPGPFSHLSSILCDVHDSSYRPYSHNALYNKRRQRLRKRPRKSKDDMLQEVMRQSIKENEKAQDWRERESRIRQENAAHWRQSTVYRQQSTDRLISILERQADAIQELVAMQKEEQYRKCKRHPPLQPLSQNSFPTVTSNPLSPTSMFFTPPAASNTSIFTTQP
ncbi:muscular LMNA-interacting protein isoform X28 [Chrysemys picta bellii]|uniref:muscular LMNA-interacting protein isoform X28 n=1 Tax=Chrysemys picta bellii TaxID=8478 RepID=UPI0032B16B10